MDLLSSLSSLNLRDRDDRLDDTPWSCSKPPVRNIPRIRVETELVDSVHFIHPAAQESLDTPHPDTNASPSVNLTSTAPVFPFTVYQETSVEQATPTITKPDDVAPTVLEIAQAIGHPLGGVLVPQKTYRPHTLNDRRRYVEEVQLDSPIMFYTHTPAGCGILLRDAIASKFITLEGRDDAMFVSRGPSVSIRLIVRADCDHCIVGAHTDVDCSGLDTRLGAGRSPPGTSVALRNLSLVPGLHETWRRPSNASSRLVASCSHIMLIVLSACIL